MYKLINRFARGPFLVTVVGCGGTGGFVAEGLCRLLTAQADLLLVDHDRVEEANLGRQNFTHDELGCFKSEALARRLSTKFRRPVAYSTLPMAMVPISPPGFVIGCVDNGPARRDIADRVSRDMAWRNGGWWIDAGNGENYGQILVGNSPDTRDLGDSFDPEHGICWALPLPTLQRPELLLQRPPRRDCAQATAAGEQGPVINQAMAVLVVELARRLIEGTCSWMQLYLDLEAGTLSTVLATPKAVARMTGVSERLLVKIIPKGGEHEH